MVSPSGGLPEILPLPYETGLRRLREQFGLVPVEYRTTRRLAATPAERAADLTAAFADPSITAIIATIGGDDQITVLPHLDPAIVLANPKPFFGFSDCTCLLAWLWNLGIVGYHGGAVMTQFGRPGSLHPVTEESLQAALFRPGDHALAPATSYGDIDLPWDDPASFTTEPPSQPASGWQWHNADRVVTGPAWGGNLEILSWLLMADQSIPDPQRLAGGVLFLETSEELPSAQEVYWILRNMGERGLLALFPAVLVGRAKAWSLTRRTSPDERAQYLAEQQAAFRRALGEYAPDAMVVFDVDLGHTDPQVVIPYGGTVRVDGPARSIVVTY
ncbi:hypothetical protein TL08_06455 [Actinoalloteichus hymeniacidonis]|uniref:MccF-like protein (Microcin C7 resistance) n=1 Tax=Actinoalloteichus hymeniacidonis TaxID=340345 RepID=A0AAC9MXA1_9PSEU|nr:hypothetical protein TL08_06455 [Actinoalloteichus hymeniacidonis]